MRSVNLRRWEGGFKIAMRDLEIRGAGNLLGAEQSAIWNRLDTISIVKCSQRLSRRRRHRTGRSIRDND